MKHLTLLLLCLALGACGIAERRLAKERDAVQDKSAAYQTGYMEGCESSLSKSEIIPSDEARYKRDDERMKTDADYALGWNDARWKCRVH